MDETVRVFTFSPLWGLPTSGPFGLKLEMCLRMAGIKYERVIADNLRKGPRRKSPWIEQGGVRMGDTTMILRHLGLDLEAGLEVRARAEGLGIARYAPDEIQALAQADVNAVSAWLDGKTWAVADHPTLTDATLFGLLAPAIWSSAETPAFSFVRRQPVITSYVERVRARFFPEVASAGAVNPALVSEYGPAGAVGPPAHI